MQAFLIPLIVVFVRSDTDKEWGLSQGLFFFHHLNQLVGQYSENHICKPLVCTMGKTSDQTEQDFMGFK